MQLFNTFTRNKQEFHKKPGQKVTLYTCGPTVYDYAHIGNFRSFVFEDLLRRFLEFKGCDVNHVMNITDVDDKTIAGANREGKQLQEFTAKYIDAFREDLKMLNIFEPNGANPKYRLNQPRATEEIPAMIELIGQLEKSGHAYANDGSVYYRVASFDKYGKLSNKKLEQNIQGARVDVDEYDKEHSSDFVLWKRYREAEGVYWDSPWGKGRPGWHIECSAMSVKHLGQPIDIHAGGEDLIFPHHENEIAQSEAASGSEFVKLWLHCKFLLVNGEKMSKSKGNFYTLRDLLAQGHDPMAVRYALLAVHYRTPLNFTMDSLKEAAEVIKRLDECYSQCLSYASRPMDYKDKEEASPAVNLRTDLDKHLQAMEAWLDDDLNISAALAQLMDIVSLINAVFLQQKKNNPHNVREAVNFFKKVDQLLGLDISAVNEIDGEIVELVDERRAARARKDFAESDRIKAVLDEKGWLVKDGKPGEPSTVKKKRRTWDFKKP